MSQETLAEMVGTTRSRMNFFMNKSTSFRSSASCPVQTRPSADGVDLLLGHVPALRDAVEERVVDTGGPCTASACCSSSVNGRKSDSASARGVVL